MTDPEMSEERNVGTGQKEDAEAGPDGGAASNGNELGAVEINAGVIARIARTAAVNVPGVAGLCTSLGDRVARLFGKRPEEIGVKVVMEGEGVSVGMRVVVDYGVRIPEVVWHVQRDVRRGIEDITGKTVKAVNIIVQNVNTQSKTSEEDVL